MADTDREGCECEDCGECSCCNCSECRVVDLYLYNCGYCCKTCDCGYLCCPEEECHCCKACCKDEENIGHHSAAHWWLCCVGNSRVGCCNQRRRQESPDVNTPSVRVGAAQSTSNKKTSEETVTSQPLKS